MRKFSQTLKILLWCIKVQVHNCTGVWLAIPNRLAQNSHGSHKIRVLLFALLPLVIYFQKRSTLSTYKRIAIGYWAKFLRNNTCHLSKCTLCCVHCEQDTSQTNVLNAKPIDKDVPLGKLAQGLGAKPPAVERFFVLFWKKSYLNAIKSHFASVQSHLKALDFWHLKAN